MIAVCSMFRDSQKWHGHDIGQVDRYLAQLESQTVGLENLDIYAIEGHSTDDTFDRLNRLKNEFPNLYVFKDEGEAVQVASNENPDRFLALSRIGNQILSKVDLSKNYDYLLWVESDLVIPPNLIERLIETSKKYPAPNIIAPSAQILADGFVLFYDTWGFRYPGGKRWTNYIFPRDGRFIMDSIGSCALIDMDLMRKGLNFGTGCFVQLCNTARTWGATIVADCYTTIYHPSNSFIEGRWV